MAGWERQCFRTQFSNGVVLVLLFLSGAVQCASQCPARPRIPDPPGWAIERGSGKGIFHRQLSEDGRWIAFNSDGAIYLMNIQTGDRRMLIPCIEVSAEAMAFTADSSLLAVGTGNGVIYVFDVPTGSLKAELHDEDWVQELHFGPRGLLIAHRADGLSIWDTSTLHQVASFNDGECIKGGPCVWQFMDSAELSSDGRFIATCGRENSGILVRDLNGNVVLWLKEPKQAVFKFLPGSPNLLMLSDSDEFVLWNVETKKIERRLPHRGYIWLHSFLPGSSDVIVQEHRSCCPDTEDIQRININTGKVLASSHVKGLLSWVSADGVWATRYDNGEILHLPSGKVVASLEYIASRNQVASWKPAPSYLVGRVLRKEVPFYVVCGLFLLLGAFGYELCRASRLALLPVLTAALWLTTWWVRELFWPLHGPAIAPALGTAFAVSTLAAILVAYILPVLGLLAASSDRDVPSRTQRVRLLCLPFLAAGLSGVLLFTALAQSNVEKERAQVEGDIRAGGELRGSGLVPWYTRNLPSEVLIAANAPAYVSVCAVLRRCPDRTAWTWVMGATFAWWGLIAAVLYRPAKLRRLRRITLLVVVAIVELAAAGSMVFPYVFDKNFRAYTSSLFLVAYLIWICWVSLYVLRSLARIRRIRAEELKTANSN